MRIKLIVLGFLFSIIGAALPQASLIGAAQAAQDEFTAQDLAAPPDATIDFDAKQMRLIFGGAKGKGVLHFKDTDYPFTMKAVTVGGVGYTEVHGTGTVHRLTKVGDFAGTYSGVGIGAALAKGKGASSFQNNKGVVVTTRSKADGAALNLGASAVKITLGK